MAVTGRPTYRAYTSQVFHFFLCSDCDGHVCDEHSWQNIWWLQGLSIVASALWGTHLDRAGDLQSMHLKLLNNSFP